MPADRHPIRLVGRPGPPPLMVAQPVPDDPAEVLAAWRRLAPLMPAHTAWSVEPAFIPGGR